MPRVRSASSSRIPIFDLRKEATASRVVEIDENTPSSLVTESNVNKLLKNNHSRFQEGILLAPVMAGETFCSAVIQFDAGATLGPVQNTNCVMLGQVLSEGTMCITIGGGPSQKTPMSRTPDLKQYSQILIPPREVFTLVNQGSKPAKVSLIHVDPCDASSITLEKFGEPEAA